jgi:hypothetical protein
MIAIIQRPRRKKHLATTRPGSSTWETLGACRFSIPVEGTSHVSIDGATSVGTLKEQDVDVCLYCLTLIAFAHVLNRSTNVTLLRGIA